MKEHLLFTATVKVFGTKTHVPKILKNWPNINFLFSLKFPASTTNPPEVNRTQRKRRRSRSMRTARPEATLAAKSMKKTDGVSLK
jgi:hypothetical protein